MKYNCLFHRFFFIPLFFLLLNPFFTYSQNLNALDSAFLEIKNNFDNKNYDKATQLCKNFLSQNPEYHDARLILALIDIRSDELDKAEKELNYIINAKPDYYEAWYLLGNISLWKGNNLQALSHYNKAFTNEYNENLLINKATAHYNIHDLDNAEKIIDSILKHNKNNLKANMLKDEINLSKAYKLVENKFYSEANVILNKYIIKYPVNTDARFKLSQSYFLSNIIDSAEYHLNIIVQIEPMHSDALFLLMKIAILNKDYDKALDICNKLIKKNPKDKNLYLQKAYLLRDKKLYFNSYKIADSLLQKNTKDSLASELAYETSPYAFPNTMTISYNIDAFRGFSPWHFFYIQYARKLKKDIVIARLNYANRYKLSGFQIEADYYKKFNRSYIYLNLGYSNSKLFPKIRFGAEYFQDLNKKFDVSVGFRFLKFDTSSVTLITASVGKYFNKLHLGYRHYALPKNNKIYSTGIVSVRRYFNYGNYIGAEFIYGFSPDANYLYNDEIYKYKSQSLRFDYFKKINPLWSFHLISAFTYEEYYIEKHRYKFGFEFILNKLF